MYILKNNKLPKFHLKFNGYRIENKNDKIIGYIKTIASKDENNYAMFYFIHIAYNLKNERSEVYVTWENIIHGLKIGCIFGAVETIQEGLFLL